MIDDGLTGSRLSDASAQIKARADELVLRIQERFERARLTAEQGRTEVDVFVRDRPYAALAIAAFAGLILGHMVSGGRPKVVYLKDARRL